MVLLAVVWVAPWLLVTADVVGAAARLCGHAPAQGSVASTTALTAVVALVLHAIARRSPTPGD